MGLILAFGLGLSIITGLFSREGRSAEGLGDFFKRVVYLAVVAGLLYYFWDSVKFYLDFGRLLVEGVALFGALLFPIFAVVIFVLLIYFLKKGGLRWARSVQAGKRLSGRTLLVALCLPCLFLVLPRSEATLLRSWEPKTGTLVEAGNIGPGLFGVGRSTYVVDDLGRMRSLALRQAPIQRLDELEGIEKLTSLERLDVEGVPLEGVLDVSAWTSLKALRLSETRLTGVTGLEKLSSLEELELDHVDLDALSNLERVSTLKRLVLTDCKVDGLERLAGLENLEGLYLDGTNVTDLSPLRRLLKLHELSVAETAVEDLRPVRNLPLFFLNTRGTKITREQLRGTFNDTLIVVHGEMGLRDGLLNMEEHFIPPEVKSRRNRVAAALAGVGLLLSLLWSVRRLRNNSLFLLRRLFSVTVWGALLALLLLTLAALKPPVYVLSDVSFPDVSAALTNWATFVAVLWLGVRPLLVLGLETSYLNASAWSVPARFAVRFIPLVALLGPVSYKVVWNAFPQTMSFIAGTSFAMAFALFGLPWMVAALLLFVGVQKWRHKLHKLRSLAEQSRNTIVEVPLRAGVRSMLFGGDKRIQLSLHGETGSTFNSANCRVLTAAAAAMLLRLPEACSAGVSASVITLRQSDLLTLKGWEIGLIRRWVESVYRSTWSPIWLISDWVETHTPDSPAVRRNLSSLDALLPYLSGTEHHFKLGATVFPLGDDEGLQKCLAANELIPARELSATHFDELLHDAFTPVAVLLRGVFGYADLTDRLDVLMRAAEIALAFFSLALTAEYEAERESFSSDERKRIDKALEWSLSRPPMFADWVTLLSTFSKCGRTETALAVRHVLDGPAPPASLELRAMLEAAAGAEEVRVGEIKSRRQVVALLNQVRNLLVAHGPITERVSPALYRATLLVSLELLTAFPWPQVSVCASEGGNGVEYRGLRPRAASCPSAGIYVRIGGGLCEAHKYFHQADGSVAMFIGEEGFFEPLSGLRV